MPTTSPRTPEPLPDRDRDVLEKLARAREEDAIQRALEAARERLAMEAAYVTTVMPEDQRVDEVAGHSEPMGFVAGTVVPLEETFCVRMLAGDLPSVVPDTRVEPSLRDVPLREHIGAYVGVPIVLPDGATHGTLCAVSTQPRPGLGDEEARFMQVLADIVAVRIARARAA